MKPSRPNGDRFQQHGPRGVIVLYSNGRIRCAGNLAIYWLEKYFPGTHFSKRLPNKIDFWLSKRRSRGVPLTVEKNRSRLVVALAAGRAHEPTCLLLEEFSAHLPNESANRLTERETEVLSWVARGKANWAIGKILNLSTATVRKHLEHIYPKLGVENRTAAAICAMEILHSVSQDLNIFQ